MTKRILSLLLALAMVLGAALYISSPALAADVTSDQIIDATLEIFGYNEGTYNSVNRNDNGALSIGKLQWHAGRALTLMKAIIAENPTAASAALGSALYQEIVNAGASAWNARVLTTDEATRFAAVLGSEAGRAVQDRTARSDISTYISHGKNLGVTAAAAMVYYCDIENQYGQYGADHYIVSPIKALTGKNTIDSLEEFHTNLLRVTSSYRARRIQTYNFCRGLGWEDSGVPDMPATPGTPGVAADTTAPVIGGAVVTEKTLDAYTVQFAASDDVALGSCTVVSRSNAPESDEHTQTARQLGSVWSVSVPVSSFSANGTVFTSEIVVQDLAGNTASTRLRVSRSELYQAAGAVELEHNCATQGHSYQPVGEPVAATCTQQGYQLEQCEYCGMCRSVDLKPATGHQFVQTVVEPTCETAGYTLNICRNCAEQLQVDSVAAVGHDWSEWHPVQAATDTTDGLKTRTCETCGETQTGVIASPVHVHSFVSHPVTATCQTGGYVRDECACGAVVIHDTTQPVEHEMVCAETVAATPDEDGYEVLRCRWCGETQTRELPDGGHLCAAFTDLTEDYWARDSICYATELGLFQGVSGALFAPQKYMTRAMLVTVLYRMVGEPEAPAGMPFQDVPEDSWYAPAVSWAKACGIINGVSAERFQPDGNVTREQLAAIFYRYARIDGEATEQGADLSGYLDAGCLSSYAIGPWMWAAERGLLQGTTSGDTVLLMPKANATRAQVAAILARYAMPADV